MCCRRSLSLAISSLESFSFAPADFQKEKKPPPPVLDEFPMRRWTARYGGEPPGEPETVRPLVATPTKGNSKRQENYIKFKSLMILNRLTTEQGQRAPRGGRTLNVGKSTAQKHAPRSGPLKTQKI